MEEINEIRSRIQTKDRVVTKENSILKFFNGVMVLALLAVSFLVYCKVDEDATFLNRIFNSNITFKGLNETIQGYINRIFSLDDNDSEGQNKPVSQTVVYQSLGNNRYATEDKTIRALKNGKIVASSYQNEYKYFIAVQYDNGVSALYTLVDTVSYENDYPLNENMIFGSYEGDYFNCIFKKGEDLITYNEAIQDD